MPKQKNFEESLKRLDDIIDEIENGASLENAVKLYKEGITLSAAMEGVLTKYETEVAELVKASDGGFVLKPFTTE